MGETMTEAGPTVLEALRRHADGFRQRYACDPVRSRVLDRLLSCRTGALGGHVLVCDECGLRTPVYKSCDDRHCPQVVPADQPPQPGCHLRTRLKRSVRARFRRGGLV